MAWEPGQSGNPEGARLHKAPSQRGKLRATLLEAAPEVVAALIVRAKAGDPVSLKLYLDRVFPTLRPQAEQIALDIEPGSLMQRAEAVLQLAASGELPIDQASEYINNVSKIVLLEQATELKAQLALLLAEKFGDLA